MTFTGSGLSLLHCVYNPQIVLKRSLLAWIVSLFQMQRPEGWCHLIPHKSRAVTVEQIWGIKRLCPAPGSWSGYGKERARHILTGFSTFTPFQVPRRRLKAQFLSGVFAHLDVAQAVRFVWSHTVVSSISPGHEKYFIQRRPSLKSDPGKPRFMVEPAMYDGLAGIKRNYDGCTYVD